MTFVASDREHFPRINFTQEQVAYIRLLEKEGLRFCVDFGYQNATQIAEDLIDQESAVLEFPK